MFNKRTTSFIKALKRIVNTEDGKYILKVLKEDYIEYSVLSESVEKTYYKLGQKELVQALIGYVEDKASLDSTSTVNL